MNFTNAIAFAAGLSLRWVWLILLPVIGLAAVTGVPIVFPF